MIRVHERTAQESYEFHIHNQPSPRFIETAQAGRILRARRFVTQALEELRADQGPRRFKICEPGCGRADISGAFSTEHRVTGWECCPEAALGAQQDWPWMTVHVADAQEIEAESCDIVIFCEFLEHVADPLGMVKKWLPAARYSLISSPVEGDRGEFQESGHLWSFDSVDFDLMLSRGQHRLLNRVNFSMGVYEMALQLGKRIEESA